MNPDNAFFTNIYFHFLLIKPFFDFLPRISLDHINYHSQSKHCHQLWMTAYGSEPKVFHTYMANGIVANASYIKEI